MCETQQRNRPLPCKQRGNGEEDKGVQGEEESWDPGEELN